VWTTAQAVGPRLYRPDHGRNGRLSDRATPGRHHGADRANALPERASPRPSPRHRVMVTPQGDERVALPVVWGEDLAGRVHDPGCHTARYVTSPRPDATAEPCGD
jgi:hypothetical protein